MDSPTVGSRTANRDVVVVGASAGGVEALRALVAGLPADLPATVLVVLHLPPGSHSSLPAILSRAGVLPARHPHNGEPLRHGDILVAPPDDHLWVEDGHARLSRGPSENGHRPAIDPLFRSAARWYGPRVVGVVLSGTLDDGTSGQLAVQRSGGVTVVQDPSDALYPGMPSSVLEHVRVDHVLPADEIGVLLGSLCREEFEIVADPSPAPDPSPAEGSTHPAVRTPVGLACLTCGGSLYEIRDAGMLRYRCRMGHAWSPESLLAEQGQALEGALWMALRTLEDRAALCRRSQRSAQVRGQEGLAQRYRGLADDAESASRVMRQALEEARLVAPLGGDPQQTDKRGD